MSKGYIAFAGQRDDGFYADIQAVFDLLQLRSTGKDSQAGFNIHLMELAIPLSELGGDQQVVGVYATTSRRQVRIVKDDDDKGKDWSERYRRHGQEGLAPVLAQAAARASEQAPQVPDLPHVCAICGADETVMVEMDFRYTPQGVLYCAEHYALWEQSEGAM